MAKIVIFGVLLFLFCAISLASSTQRLRRATALKDVHNAKWNATKADILKRDLMANYDKFVRPSEQGNTTVVSFHLTVHHVDVDEMKSTLIVHCFIAMRWKDDKLKWNTSEYGGLRLFHLADHEIWQPDVVPYNSADRSTVDMYGNTHSIVSYDGSITWVPPAILRTFCSLNLKKWPFDTQTCEVKFGSWVHDGNDLDLKLEHDDPELELAVENSEWRPVSVKHKRNVVLYNCCPEPYIDVTYVFKLKRQGAVYRTLIITPITAIVLMTLATFWLPAGSSEKISLGAITTLIISLFLIYFSCKLPVISGGSPLIASFYSSSLYLVACSIIVSVLVINLATCRHGRPLPWIIKTHLNGKFGKYLLFNNLFVKEAARPSSMGDSDNQPVISNENDNEPASDATQRDWILLATAIDRLTFLIYCLLFICYALAYLT